MPACHPPTQAAPHIRPYLPKWERVLAITREAVCDQICLSFLHTPLPTEVGAEEVLRLVAHPAGAGHGAPVLLRRQPLHVLRDGAVGPWGVRRWEVREGDRLPAPTLDHSIPTCISPPASTSRPQAVPAHQQGRQSITTRSQAKHTSRAKLASVPPLPLGHSPVFLPLRVGVPRRQARLHAPVLPQQREALRQPREGRVAG